LKVLAEIQNEILNNNIILIINADVLLPRIGGYNARPYSSELQLYELPRASELKALWRWWLRVILSSIFEGQKTYDMLDEKIGEILGNTKQQSMFTIAIDTTKAEQVLVQARDKIKRLEHLLMKIIPESINRFTFEYNRDESLKKKAKLNGIKLMPLSIRFKVLKDFKQFEQEIKKFGLSPKPRKKGGEAECCIESSEGLSRLMKSIGINYYDEEIVQLYDEIVKLVKIPRITLLKQPRREDREDDEFKGKISEDNKKYLKRILEDIVSMAVVPTSLPIKIVMGMNDHVKLDDEELKLALASLLLSLLLGGIGSITRRGFGSIVLRNVEPKPKYEGLVKEVVEKINRILQVENEDELKGRLIEYIKFVCGLADRVYKKEISHTSQKILIPNVPTLLPNTDYFKLEVFECNKYKSVIDILNSIGKATLKAEWKRICNVNVRKPGGEFHTWILGLPRSMEDPKSGKKTGYFIINNDRGRRPSAIAFKIFENKNGKKFVILYGFLSKDWPVEELIHMGEHRYKGQKEAKVIEIGIMRPSRQCEPLRQDVLSSGRYEEFLRQVFEAAFNFVTEIIKKECKGGRS